MAAVLPVWSQKPVSNRHPAASAESPPFRSSKTRRLSPFLSQSEDNLRSADQHTAISLSPPPLHHGPSSRDFLCWWPERIGASAESPPPPSTADGRGPCRQSEGIKELQMDQASDPAKASQRRRQVYNNGAISPKETCEKLDKKRKRDTERSTIERELEEKLNQREDNLYQLDLLLGCIKGAINQVEKLLENIKENTAGTMPKIDIQNYLSFKSSMCIEQLYGDHGLEVMNVLKKNTLCALPVILARLRQKKEEWSLCRAHIGKR